MGLGREMTTEQRDDFRRRTEDIALGGGLDLTTYSGAIAAMQNMGQLPEVMQAAIQGLTKVTGSGEMRTMTLANAFFGGQMAPALALNPILEQLARANLPAAERKQYEQRFKKMLDDAGPDKEPWEQDRQMEQIETRIGRFKRISQSIKGTLLDFATDLEEATAIWESRISPIAND